MKRLALLLSAIALLIPSAAGAGLDSPEQLYVPAWTPTQTATWPAQGGYSVADYTHLAGYIGLSPTPPAAVSTGEVTFRWYADLAGEQITGVQGFPVTSLIVANAMLNVPNMGPYVRVSFECFSGSCPVAMRLFGTNRANKAPLTTGDAILIDEKDLPLAAHSSIGGTVYPDAYFAGPVRLYLNAPAGFYATVYGADLLGKWWPLDQVKATGAITTITPFGAWLVVVSNPTAAAGKFTISATPDVTQTAKASSR